MRGELMKSAAELPGSRVLEQSFGANRLAMAVAKGQAAGRLAYMREFVHEARTSGLIERAIDRSGFANTIVPAAKTN